MDDHRGGKEGWRVLDELKYEGSREGYYGHVHFVLYTRITGNLRILNTACAPVTWISNAKKAQKKAAQETQNSKINQSKPETESENMKNLRTTRKQSPYDKALNPFLQVRLLLAGLPILPNSINTPISSLPNKNSNTHPHIN